MNAQRGFTLIELLVVIVIMATMIGTATLGFGRGEAQRFISQGQQMQAWLQQLQTESILTSSTWGAVFDESSARAVVWSNGRWLETTEIEPFHMQDNVRIALAEALRQEPSATPVLRPQLMVLPTGQMMPPAFINLSTPESSLNLTWLNGPLELEFQ